MSRLEHALRLAERGFYVFPVVPDGKLPAIKDWVNKATREPEQISKWWSNRDYNIGISTSRFGDDKALCVVDVDTKEGKDGERSLLQLELQGQELPVTLEQATPSGGRHLVYLVDAPLKQGVDVLGSGLDIRSRGGFILGPGSEIGGRKYAQINGHGVLAAAPGWLVDRLGRAPERSPVASVALAGVDADRAKARAIAWVKEHAPLDGDPEAYPVACMVKDFGVTEDVAIEILKEHWDPFCVPPRTDDTETVVRNAYRYGREPQGVAAPEAVFAAAEPPAPAQGDEQHPVEALNREFAFIKRGAFILQETRDEEGRFTTERMSPADMHAWFANKLIQIGDKKVPLSKLWMSRPTRREYDAVVFQPGRASDPRFYNLWRGFSYEPKAGGHKALDAFLEHAKVNVCGGNEGLFRWLMGWFAHLVQHPDEKPLVATVFRGAKGTGKNALVERVGALLGEHFMVADDDRYLLGNFNSHLESNLFFVLDEAAWAGDKRAEGRLKGLITGTKHTIERKGQEPYRSRNLTRVAIIGNEEWLVPASQDERRFAVFTVGNGRRQDRKFFTDMRVGMERGGYSHLLHYLLHFDLSTVDVNEAPKTEGLIEQKIASLEPPEQWWLDCLTHGYIAGGDMGGEWPGLIPTNRLRDAYLRWAKNRNIRGWLLEERGFGRRIKKLIPGATRKRTGAAQMGDATWSYILPALDAARAAMEALVDGKIDWENDE